MNTLMHLTDGPKAKTFSRARAIEIIRNQYRNMKYSEKSMQQCLELMTKTGDQDHYQKSFYESMGRYQMAEKMLEDLCDGFGIDLKEIDPRVAVG